MRSKWLAVPVCAAAFVAFGAGAAGAQGKVEQGPDHANSICSYSGLNDDPDDPFEGGRTQSYGQLVRLGHVAPSEVRSGPPSPGFFCNGHLFPYPEAFEGEAP